MTTIYMKLTDPAVASLLAKTFPGCNYHTATVHVSTGGMPLTSYWSGGTREYHKIIRLSDLAVFAVPENGSGFSQTDRVCGPAGLPVSLPAPDFAVVTHTQGSSKGIAISIHPDNAAKLLPAPIELSWAERVVLVATRSLKSSYAGISDYRYHEAHQDVGITRDDWDTAKAALIGRKLLNSAGAITTEGKNAAGTGDLYRLKRT